MRVALGILNKEIERLQQELDSMSNIQSNPAKYARLTSEIEELLEAWQVLKEWKRPERYVSSWKEEIVEKEAKYDHCRCVSPNPYDYELCDKCPDKQKPLHDPTTYTQAEKPKFPEDRVPLINLASYIEP